MLAATWDMAWCWRCKQDRPLEPVHDETECPHRSRDEDDTDPLSSP